MATVDPVQIVHFLLVNSAGQIRYKDAVTHLMEMFKIGRRQATRYWVKAREPYLSDKQRYYRANVRAIPRDRTGRFVSRTLHFLPKHNKESHKGDGPSLRA